MRISKSERPFAERVARIWGGLNEIGQTGEDTDVAVAAFFQVTPRELEAWRDAEGRHRCAGVTTRGHGCRNYASTVVDYDPRAWVARDPAYCPSHLTSLPEPAATRPASPEADPRPGTQSAPAKDDERVTAR